MSFSFLSKPKGIDRPSINIKDELIEEQYKCWLDAAKAIKANDYDKFSTSLKEIDFFLLDNKQPQIDGKLLLQMATFHLRVDMVEALLDKKANPNQLNTQGYSTLDTFIALGFGTYIAQHINNHFKIFSLLITHKAQFNYSNVTNANNQTPLHVIALKNHHENENSSDIICSLIEETVDSGIDVNTQDSNGTTPLHHAVISANEKVISCLLKLGAKKDISDLHYKKTAQQLAQDNYSQNGNQLSQLLEDTSEQTRVDNSL